MMTALVPRRLVDLTDWIEDGFRFGDGHMIRVEDRVLEDEYEIRAELPGVDPANDLQVTVEDGLLTIHAERREEKKTAARSEFRYGSLDRSVRLPRNAEAEKITARYDNGLLTVTVPLTRTKKPAGRTISISTERPASGSRERAGGGKAKEAES